MNSKLENLWEEVRELSLGTTPQIDRLETPPTPLQFLRHYLSQNKPFILSPSAATTLHWPATILWTSTAYLRRVLSSSNVSLHRTPTGQADALTSHPSNPHALCFASADVQPTPFSDAIDAIAGSRPGFVAYAQQQNDCFREEYGALAGDCDSHLPWATEAIGASPEAVNLWIGNDLSETSFHKDHYENLYAVVTGEKHFVLLPPTDVHRMYIRGYPAAQYSYSQETQEFKLELENPPRHVPWCSVNPYPSPENKEKETSEFPLYYNGPKPFEVTVKAGEILYLPSMWFHHVRQTPDNRGLTIAVNYWYDMQFDIKYAYFNFLQSLTVSSCSFGDELNGGDSFTTENVVNGDENHIEESRFVRATYTELMAGRYGQDYKKWPPFDRELWDQCCGGTSKGRLYGFGSMTNPDFVLTGLLETPSTGKSYAPRLGYLSAEEVQRLMEDQKREMELQMERQMKQFEEQSREMDALMNQRLQEFKEMMFARFSPPPPPPPK